MNNAPPILPTLAPRRATTADTPDSFGIPLPEQVAVTLPLAGVGTRMLAAIFDALIVVFIFLFLAYIAAFIGLALIFQDSGFAAGSVFGALALVGTVAFLLAYYAGLELLWDGQTPGKRMMRIRVVRDDGSPVDAAAVLARNVLRLVDFLPLGYLVGLVTMFADGRARRLGDMVGGTVVVREGGSTPTLREVGAAADPAALPPPPDQIAPTYLLTADELAAAREFLRRAGTFAPAERAAIAWRVATTLAVRMGYPQPPPQPEWFLVWVLQSAAHPGGDRR